jgi:hypothetical protein
MSLIRLRAWAYWARGLVMPRIFRRYRVMVGRAFARTMGRMVGVIILRFQGQGQGRQSPLDRDSGGTNPEARLDPVKNRCRAPLRR